MCRPADSSVSLIHRVSCVHASFSPGQEHSTGLGPGPRGSASAEGCASEEQRRRLGGTSAQSGHLPAHTVANTLLQTHVLTCSQGAEVQRRLITAAGRDRESHKNVREATKQEHLSRRRESCEFLQSHLTHTVALLVCCNSVFSIYCRNKCLVKYKCMSRNIVVFPSVI